MWQKRSEFPRATNQIESVQFGVLLTVYVKNAESKVFFQVVIWFCSFQHRLVSWDWATPYRTTGYVFYLLITSPKILLSMCNNIVDSSSRRSYIKYIRIPSCVYQDMTIVIVCLASREDPSEFLNTIAFPVKTLFATKFASLCSLSLLIILWRIDPLLGNDSICTFQRTRNNRSCVLYEPCHNALFGNTTMLHKRRWCFLWSPTRGYKMNVYSWGMNSYPCGGGVEYFHRDPASRRRRRKWRSQIWDIKVWSGVPRESDPTKTALARASSISKRQTRPLVREGAPQKQDRNYQKVINIWSWAPHAARHQVLLTGWPSIAMWLWSEQNGGLVWALVHR
jgi:hypothetical protein